MNVSMQIFNLSGAYKTRFKARKEASEIPKYNSLHFPFT